MRCATRSPRTSRRSANDARRLPAARRFGKLLLQLLACPAGLLDRLDLPLHLARALLDTLVGDLLVVARPRVLDQEGLELLLEAPEVLLLDLPAAALSGLVLDRGDRPEELPNRAGVRLESGREVLDVDGCHLYHSL